MKFLPRIILACVLLAADKLFAEDIRTLLDDAANLAVQNDSFHALPLLKRATLIAWEQSESSFSAIALVEEDASGYGIYKERAHNIYQPSETIRIYAEPVGYRFRVQNDEYTFGYSADFAVLTEEGKRLGGQEAFQRWTFSSRHPLFEFYINLAYNLTGATPGKYQIQTTLNDLNSANKATFTRHIEISLTLPPEPEDMDSRYLQETLSIETQFGD